ncbi:hypothetical protein KY289_031173 [Solanum tuberosum]|nr:hypothetical protein KY289_031173 [Solanum tuberosum]
MDMRILETCLLKVNVFASLGTLLLWKDNFGLAPVAKYLCSFWSASIMLIVGYFHRCKSKGLDTTNPLVSRPAFLVLTRLVFSVGLQEQNCATYSIQAVVVLTIGVGIFNIGADNDLPTRNSTDAKIIVPLIVVWTAGTCSLFIPWYTTLLLVHVEISSANLIFTTTLRICHMVNLHNTFIVLHSLRSWTKQLTMISSQRYQLENKTEHMWLPLSNGIVITIPFNGIDRKKYVSPYESGILLLLTLLYLNLEDKVLIEGGSIVVNRVGYVRAYGLELVETNLVGIIGPSKMLECFIWDPGPISIWLKGRMNLKEGFMHELRHIYMPKLSIFAYELIEVTNDLESISLISLYLRYYALKHVIRDFRNSQGDLSQIKRKDARIC